MELVNGGRIAREVWKVNSGSHALARTAANRVLLGTGHTGLSSELSRWSWPRDRQALESHLIDEGSFELLCQQNETGFLTRREAAVVGAVHKLILQRTAWDQPLLRPLECYYEEPMQQQ